VTEHAASHQQQTGILDLLTAHSPFVRRWLDVLVVPQQGVYDKRTRKFHCEYADRGVYRKHLQEVPQIVSTWRCNCVVMTGGHTQKAVPDVSEAQGALDLFHDLGVKMTLRHNRIIAEGSALDSAENVIFSLMLARMSFPRVPIGQVVIWPAWSFKTQRFNLAAHTLGILEQTYICGGYGPEAANDGERAISGEKGQLAKMLADNDPLLLGAQWEQKRRDRYQGNSYEHRLDHLRCFFPGCFVALDHMRADGIVADALAHLQESFRVEVMMERGGHLRVAPP
jgi:hypothetical protein